MLDRIRFMVMLRRPWVEQERLIYPIMQLNLSMVQPAEKGSLIAPFFRNPVMWAGLSVPAIVGTVALDTPEAVERGFPDPDIAITSKTSIMPVTVPINPISGHNATHVFINAMLRSSPWDTVEISSSRI